MNRRAVLQRLAAAGAALALQVPRVLPRVAERAYVWRQQWEQYGAQMYGLGWRVIDQEWTTAADSDWPNLVRRYVIERAT